MQELTGRVAVVTGGASGIGLALAHAFGAEGMKVVIADIEPDALERAAAELRGAGLEVRAVVCDVSDGEAVDALAAAAVDAFGAVHVVCNNAGVSGGGLLQDLTTKDWEWILGVNLWGVIHGVRAFLPLLVAQGEGHVVNTGSVLGLFSAPFTAPYSVSKYGVVALSESLFHELAMTSPEVGVSVLCPGWVDTNLHSADRNRPTELRDDTDPDSGTGDPPAVGDGIGEVLKGVMAEGMAPAEVAANVVAAVKDRQFYVITHESSNDAIAGRTEAILERRDPGLYLPT